MMTKIDIGTEIGRGWAVFKENMGLLILATLVAMLIGGVTCGILTGPMMAGVFLIVYRLLKNDPEKPKVGDVFKGFDYFLDTFLCFLVIMIATSIISAILSGIIAPIGWVVSVVGGVFVDIAVLFVVFGKLKFVDALKKIVEDISTGPFWMLVLTIAIANLIGVLGVIACGIGVFFTLPIWICITVCAYLTAYGDGPLTVAQPAAPAQLAEPPAVPPAQ